VTDEARRGNEASQTRIDLLDRTLSYCTEDYDRVSTTYAALDSKAQATFGVSGLFIAGTVAVLNSITASTEVFWWTVVFVVLTYGLLVSAVVASVFALRVREVATPMDSAALASMTLEVIGLPMKSSPPRFAPTGTGISCANGSVSSMRSSQSIRGKHGG